jgi:hypothetical protein
MQNEILAGNTGFNLPLSLKLIASGTLNQVCPATIAQARSVLPTPVAKAPRAPYVQV